MGKVQEYISFNFITAFCQENMQDENIILLFSRSAGLTVAQKTSPVLQGQSCCSQKKTLEDAQGSRDFVFHFYYSILTRKPHGRRLFFRFLTGVQVV
jgi:hypothetical protein